jgi:hypothetical protein
MAKDLTKPLTQVATKVMGKTLSTPLKNFNPLSFVSDFVELYTEIQRQRTERARIESETEVRLAVIEAKRRIFLDYLDMAFAERKENFSRLFDAVDAAMANGSNDQLAMALNSINELARTTPFKDLIDVDRTRQLLAEPGHEWKF